MATPNNTAKLFLELWRLKIDLARQDTNRVTNYEIRHTQQEMVRLLDAVLHEMTGTPYEQPRDMTNDEQRQIFALNAMERPPRNFEADDRKMLWLLTNRAYEQRPYILPSEAVWLAGVQVENVADLRRE